VHSAIHLGFGRTFALGVVAYAVAGGAALLIGHASREEPG